jgi:hypothetical protein
MMIRREYYLSKVRQVLNKPLIKVLLGMRRVGKSTLLKQIMEELAQNGIPESQIIFINFELLQFEPFKDYQSLNEYLRKLMTTNMKYYIFLDEVQEVQGFEKVVNSLNAEGIAEVFITGSNSKLLSGELATYMTGRTYSIEVFPLSFYEIQSANIEEDRETLFVDYIKNGGMPARFDFESIDSAKNYLSDMYRSILLKDIVSRYSIRDVDLLERFLIYVLHNISQIFSANSITKFLKSEGRKLSKETIYNYIDACRNAYLIHSIPRYNIKSKELLRTNEKYFINDLGIRGLYFNNEEDIGQSLENIVLLDLLRRNKKVYVGKIDEYEVDFVVVDGSDIEYIQVTYLLAEDSTIEREFSALERINDNYPKTVLSMDRIDRSRNGIQHKNIIDFLLRD